LKLGQKEKKNTRKGVNLEAELCQTGSHVCGRKVGKKRRSGGFKPRRDEGSVGEGLGHLAEKRRMGEGGLGGKKESVHQGGGYVVCLGGGHEQDREKVRVKMDEKCFRNFPMWGGIQKRWEDGAHG